VKDDWFCCPSQARSAQFRYSARLDPLHHEDVAFVIKARAVRQTNLPGTNVPGA
jgi:hypothetical protein